MVIVLSIILADTESIIFMIMLKITYFIVYLVLHWYVSKSSIIDVLLYENFLRFVSLCSWIVGAGAIHL